MGRGLWVGGEVFVTCGVLLMLLVVHQVWWTNREARGGAEETVRALEREWEGPGESGGVRTGAGVGVEGESGGGGGSSGDLGSSADSGSVGSSGGSAGEGAGAASAGSGGGGGSGTTGGGAGSGGEGGKQRVGPPRWDQAYAVIRIPKVGVVAPVAQGVGKRGVLDKGYVGHYPGTAQPGQAGNFALAGHRNTHGEPFRYINRLRAGDELTVETREAVFTYVVSGGVPQTSARDVEVIGSVPRSGVRAGYGYREPGYYLTLTTCTPEFTSKYRLVVWGKLVRMRPR
ncbi:class E sortase [Streptomyces sp. NPDC048442]|uniref:class E sortase n=1 Tax=Streptomyces sp. NPDC048442 TaxID=3154823 RepID=UPI0034321ABC